MSKAPLPSDKPVKKAPPPKKPAAAAAAKKPPAGAASPSKKLPPAVVKAAVANASLGANAKLQSKAKQAAAKPAGKPAVVPTAKSQAATPPAASSTKPQTATPPTAAGAKPASPSAQAATPPSTQVAAAAGGGHKAASVSPAANVSGTTKAVDPRRPLAGFIGPLPKHLEPLRAGQRDPTEQELQRHLSGIGRKVAQIDQRAQELLARPVDVGKAKRAVQASDQRLSDFYKKAAQGFSGKEREKLVGLWNGTRGKRGADLKEARRKYGEAYLQALSPKQRQQLDKLDQQGIAARERQAERQLEHQAREGVRRAHQKLQEVQAKRHEQHQTGADAKALNGQVKKAKEQVKTAQEDVRLVAAAGLQREVDNKLLDLQRRPLNASDHKALQGPRKELMAAAQAVQADLKDPRKQTSMAVTQANFDHALNGRLSEQQRAKRNELATEAEYTRQAAQVVANEVGAQRELRAAQAAITAASGKPGGASEVQRRREEVAQARVTLQAHDRQVRWLADQVLKNPGSKSLGGQYTRAQLQNQGLQADLNAARAKHDLARAARVNYIPVRAAKGFSVKPPSPVKSVTPAMEATVRLVDALKQRSQVNAALAPPKVEKPSTLDRALAVAGGLGEVVGGVALGIATGASGVGLAAGFVIALDGIGRVGHAVSDWENDTVTDTPQSQFMQGLGMSRDVANRTDAAIALGATLAGGGIAGTVKMITSGSHLVRGAGWLSTGLLADTTQAQGRYALTGDHVMPLTVERMTAAGLDESRANALLVGASLSTSGVALKSGVSANAPGTAYRGFKQFPKAAAEGGTSVATRSSTSAFALAADAPKPAAAAPKPAADTYNFAASLRSAALKSPEDAAVPKSTAPASSAAAARPSTSGDSALLARSAAPLAVPFRAGAGLPRSGKSLNQRFSGAAARPPAPASPGSARTSIAAARIASASRVSGQGGSSAMTGGLVATLPRTRGVALRLRELPAQWFSRAIAMSGGGSRQQRARPAIEVWPRYRPPPKVTRPVGNVLLAFDGTGQREAIGRPSTNIVHLARRYGGDVQYFPGVGSAGQLDRTYGGTTGAGWRRRVRDAISQLVDYVNRSPHPVVYVDIVGFSRGAAIARVVSNVMANHIGRGGYTREVQLRFLGLFDTVDTGMLRRPEHRAALLKIPRKTAYAVQAVAAHERRAFFPVASIEPSTFNPGSHPRRKEMSFIGDHSDIGGGHDRGDLSNLTLRWMMSHAQDVGAPMLPSIGRLDDVRMPLLHQQEGTRLIVDRTGPGADRLINYPNDPNWDPAAVLLQADRVNGITRAEAEQWIYRFVSADKKLAGRVNVAAYTDELLRRGYFP